jgi:hypothetical protein
MRNAVLAAGNLPKEYRDWGQKASIRQPIASLEEAMGKKGKGSLQMPWPGDLILRVNDCFIQNMTLVQAWLQISTTDFVAAIESVRNRILTFAIEAERVMKPDASNPSSVPPAAALSQVFHTHVYGHVGNLAQASTGFTQTSGVAPGDLPALLAALQALGVPQEDIAALEVAVNEDVKEVSAGIGQRVAKWMGSLISKAASGAMKVSAATATSVVPKLVEQYFHLNAGK